MSTSSTISTNEVLNIIDRLKCKGNRDSTRKNYYSIWRHFNEFYIKLDVKLPTWEERLTLFVAYLIETNKKSNTIKCYISAIKSVLMEDGVELNENKYLLTSLTKACRLVNDRVKTRLPVKKGMLGILLNMIEQIFDEERNQPYLSILYRALFSTCYYGLFRIGEITNGSHPIAVKDVHIGVNKKKMLFILHTSKTHWRDSKPQLVKISSSGAIDEKKKHCPFKLLRDFINVRRKYKSDHEPFFVFSDRTPVDSTSTRKVFKLLLERCSFNTNAYGLHGFRAGRATDLAAAKIPIPLIMKLGRWRPNVVYKYLR